MYMYILIVYRFTLLIACFFFSNFSLDIFIVTFSIYKIGDWVTDWDKKGRVLSCSWFWQ